MSNKPIEEMTAISVSDRIGLLRKALVDGVARAMAQEGNDGLPTFDDLVEKYFPELFAEPAVPGKGSQIKAGEIFTLSCSSVPEYEATTYVAKQDFDLKVEYEKQLELHKEELQKQPGDFDIRFFGRPFGSEYPGILDLEIAQRDMSERLREEGVIEVFQCRVHHLGLSSKRSNEENIKGFYEGHWCSATGESVDRPE